MLPLRPAQRTPRTQTMPFTQLLQTHDHYDEQCDCTSEHRQGQTDPPLGYADGLFRRSRHRRDPDTQPESQHRERRGDRCGQSRSHARQSLTSQADDRDRTVTGQGTRYAAVAVNPADGPRSRRTAEWVPAQFEGADVFTLAVAGGAGAPNGDAPDPRRRGVSAQVVDRAGVSVVGQPLWMTFRIVAERPAVVFHVLVVDVSVVVLADFAAVFH